MMYLRKTFGWVLTVLSAYLLIVCTFLTGAALFGALETESFGEQIAISVIFLILAVLFFGLLRLGLRIRKVPAKQEAAPASPVETMTEPVPPVKTPTKPEPVPEATSVALPSEPVVPAPSPKKIPVSPGKPKPEPQKAEKATPYTRAKKPYEVAGPGGNSLHERESAQFLFLSDASLAPSRTWGEWEYFAVNTNTWQPFYILSQYDGAHVAHTWYTIKEAVTWEEVEEYASERCKYQLGGKPGAPWKNLVVHRETTPTSFRILWRVNKDHHSSASIKITEEGFVVSYAYLNSGNKTRKVTVSRGAAGNEVTFHHSIRDLHIHEDYILKELRDYMRHNDHPGRHQRTQAPAKTDWELLAGHPSGHGDQISIGKTDSGYILRITNDGYPNRMAGGGFDCAIPQSILRNGKLDRRKFEAFYQKTVPDGPALQYDNCSWFSPAEPMPQGAPTVLKELHREFTPAPNAFYSFEGNTDLAEVVLWDGSPYLRVSEIHCTAGNNSRPVWTRKESFHSLTQVQTNQISQINWKNFTAGVPTWTKYGVDSD